MMAASQSVKHLTDYIKCSICLEEMSGRTPKSLPCLHTFCSQCIDDLLCKAPETDNKDGKTVCCPVCYKPAEIPGRSSANLPTCVYIEKLDGALRELKKKCSPCGVCQMPDSECEATHHCFQCMLTMCLSCFEKHSHTDIALTHSAVACVMCEEHEKCFDAFCTDCKKPLCKQCPISDHLAHKICHITSEKKECLEVWKKDLTDKEKFADESLEKIEAIQERFNTDMDTAEDEVDRHLLSLITQLEMQHDALKQQLRRRRKEVNENLENAKTIFHNAKKWIQRMQEPDKIWQILIEEKPEANTNDFSGEIPSVDVNIDNPKAFVFKPHLEQPILADIVEAEDGDAPLFKAPRLVNRIEDLTSIRDMGYLCNGMLVIGDYNKGLQVYDTSLHLTEHPLSGKCKGKINFISLHSKDLIVAVTCSGNQVKVFTAEGSTWHETMFSTCQDAWMLIGFMSNGDIILTDRASLFHHFFAEHGIICKYSREGQQIWNKTLPTGATDICIDNRDRIIICYSDHVTVYDKSVRQIFSIQTLDSPVVPVSVCVDPDDNILVADNSSKAVLQFDRRGTYRKQILKLGGCLRGIALHRNVYLAVWLRGTLLIYKLC